MLNVYSLKFHCDDDIESAKKRANKCIDEAYASERKEMKRIDDFIDGLAKTTKALVNSKDFDVKIDAWKNNLKKQKNSTKRSFFTYYCRCTRDVIEDIVGLVKDFSSLSEDKEKVDEKK